MRQLAEFSYHDFEVKILLRKEQETTLIFLDQTAFFKKCELKYKIKFLYLRNESKQIKNIQKAEVLKVLQESN